MYLRLFGLRLRHHDVLGCTGCSCYRELDEVSCIRLEASSHIWMRHVALKQSWSRIEEPKVGKDGGGEKMDLYKLRKTTCDCQLLSLRILPSYDQHMSSRIEFWMCFALAYGRLSKAPMKEPSSTVVCVCACVCALACVINLVAQGYPTFDGVGLA